MRILLTGARGQVGWELQRSLACLGTVYATDRLSLDLSDAGALRESVRTLRPELVVNAAAYTAVDAAETAEAAAALLNRDVPRLLAEESERLGAWFVHFSTDYVFDGQATRPYIESDAPAPLGVYGRTKLEGERAVANVGGRYLIFRLSWVYGLRGRNFLLTMRRLAHERDQLRVVADQVGVPTWSRCIAEATALVLARRPEMTQAGLYHLAGEGSASWHDFATTILADDPTRGGFRARVAVPITTVEFPTAARRPRNAVLDASRLAGTFDLRLPPWREQLRLVWAGETDRGAASAARDEAVSDSQLVRGHDL